MSDNITFPVHQVFGASTTPLVIKDVQNFTNGVYECRNSADIAALLGIFISPAGMYVIADASTVWWQQVAQGLEYF